MYVLYIFMSDSGIMSGGRCNSSGGGELGVLTEVRETNDLVKLPPLNVRTTQVLC